MRVTYRDTSVVEYWANRWQQIPADNAKGNINKYPLKYALETITTKEGVILEAGCGAGRILRYFRFYFSEYAPVHSPYHTPRSIASEFE